MSKMIIITLTLVVLSAPASSFAGEISTVTILDEKFEVISVLKDSELLNSFETLWNKKIRSLAPKETKWLYKIDTEVKGHSDRWLYSSEGYARVLSKAKVPTYKISSVDKFNKLIGVHSKAVKREAAKDHRAP